MGTLQLLISLVAHKAHHFTMADRNPHAIVPGQAIYKENEDCKTDWHKTHADFDIRVGENDKLQIAGKPVMERWETPYMHMLANAAACKGGKVLELGFGLAIAATQTEKCGVDEHWIVECNDGVFKNLEKWAKDQPSKVVGKHGLSEDVCPTLPDNFFDGILYDTYPLTDGEWHTHHLDFIKTHCMRLLKPGGVLSFCNLTSWGELLKPEGADKRVKKYTDIVTMFKATQMPLLRECGFEDKNCSWEILDIVPPKDCDYYAHNQMLAPRCFKNE